MAPINQPRSLVDISFTGIAHLIVNSCSNIESRSSVGQLQWQAYVDSVQSVLLRHVPPPLWDAACAAAHSLARTQRKISDCTVFYSVLMHTSTRKLTLTPMFKEQGCFCDESQCEPHTDIWISLVERLVNLVEIDVSLDLIHISTEDFYRALGRTCRKLQVLRHCHSTADIVPSLRGCKQLRSITFIGCPCHWSMNQLAIQRMEEALTAFPLLEELDDHIIDMRGFLESFEDTTPLQLLSLNINYCSPADVSKTVLLCPHLQSLGIAPDINVSEEIFQILANSSLRLVKLDVDNFSYDAGFQCFLESKGMFLESLNIDARHQNEPYATMLQIGKWCQGLTSLGVSHRMYFVGEPYTAVPDPGSIYQSLKSFNCKTRYPRIPQLCISQAKELTSLSLGCDRIRNDELLTLLTPERLGQVSDVCFCMTVSKEVVRLVYDNCPKLVRLDVGPVTHRDVLDYLLALQKEIVQDNLDLKLMYYEVAT